MTTSIFLPKVVDFMLPIDFYSRFDPITTLCHYSDDEDEDGDGKVLERVVSQVMVVTFLDNLIFMAVAILAKIATGIAIPCDD